MSGGTHDFANSTGMELKLYQAYQRIVAGKPEHESLKRKARNNKLKVSFTNIALEADCSRTLISLKDCAYPNIRNLVVSDKSKDDKGDIISEENGTLSERLIQQAKTISALKKGQKLSNSVLAAYVRRLSIVGQQLEEHHSIESRKNNGLINADDVAEIPLHARPTSASNVVKIGKREI